MMDFITVFLGVFLIGVVIYATAWWQGWGTMSLRVTKWYFIIFTVLALLVAVYDSFVDII